jgi:hypothetical protein
LLVGLGQHDARALDDDAHRRDVFSEVAQRLDRLARRLQRDPRIEHLLDDAQLDEILVRVEALRSAAVRVAHRRTNKISASPVVELAVRDPHDLADLRPAVPLVGHDKSVTTPRSNRKPRPS